MKYRSRLLDLFLILYTAGDGMRPCSPLYPLLELSNSNSGQLVHRVPCFTSSNFLEKKVGAKNDAD